MRRIKSKKKVAVVKDATDKTAPTKPSRLCAVTRTTMDSSLLLRFVVGPDGSMVEDITGKLPGRGKYVQPSRQNVAQLLKGSGIKGETLDTQLERIAQGLQRRLLDGLNLARRAGNLRWGVRELTELADGLVNARDRSSPPMLWLLASDAASNTHEKFAGQCRKVAGATAVEPETFKILDRNHFATVCGGGEVAVLIVYSEGMVARVRADSVRLQSFLAVE
ncbi:MAG: DUF448 domain-containing protein [Magnetococcales bacterium]|nr:DUF448 domain-containing protein [Magnetococcales bacterium]